MNNRTMRYHPNPVNNRFLVPFLLGAAVTTPLWLFNKGYTSYNYYNGYGYGPQIYYQGPYGYPGYTTHPNMWYRNGSNNSFGLLPYLYLPYYCNNSPYCYYHISPFTTLLRQ